jgi:hypothetical protein
VKKTRQNKKPEALFRFNRNGKAQEGLITPGRNNGQVEQNCDKVHRFSPLISLKSGAPIQGSQAECIWAELV